MMNSRLKNTLGLMLGLLGWAVAGHAQLDVEWTIVLKYSDVQMPEGNYVRNDNPWEHEVYESSLSGSVLLKIVSITADAKALTWTWVQIDPTIGKVVGQHIQIHDSPGWEPVLAGHDWLLVAQNTGVGLHYEYRIANGLGGYETSVFPYPAALFANRHYELFRIDPNGRAGRHLGLYVVSKSSGNITIQKLKPTLRVTDPQLNSAPQSSINRTDTGVTLSTDTQAGQSYRVQSSQDLRQWSDEEVIQGDGSTKSVQRPADKPREFLRVVEE